MEFFIDNSNRFAFAAIEAIKKENGINYSPVTIMGTSGIGKTHLVKMLEQEVKGLKTVIRVSSEQIINEYIGSVRSEKTTEFYDKYKKIDMLIIEDIQFLEGKNIVQEAVYYILRYLSENCKKIVLTVDTNGERVYELDFLNPKIISFIETGLIADIDLPTDEIKYKVIKQFEKENNIQFTFKEINDLVGGSEKITDLQGKMKKKKLIKETNLKRVCLNIHTKMSELEGVVDIKEYIDTAEVFGIYTLGITDIENVQAFSEIYRYRDTIERKGIKVLYGVQLKTYTTFESIGDIKNQVHIYARNQNGLKNLYRLVTKEKRNGAIDINSDFFKEHSEGIIIGSGTINGEIYLGYLLRKSDEEIEKLAIKYDFLEIQQCYGKEINEKIVKLGEKLNKLVIATNEVYFINEADYLSHKILKSTYSKYKGASLEKEDSKIKSTEEMLEQFYYLGEDKAYEVVIKNPNILSNLFQEIELLPKGTSYPKFEDSAIKIASITKQKLEEMYGDDIPHEVMTRYSMELESIIRNQFENIYYLGYLISKKAREDKQQVMLRGSGSASLIAYLLGVSFINPIEYNIPFETFGKLNGDFEPDFDFNFSREYQYKIHQYVIDLLGKEKVVYGGIIWDIPNMTAEKIVEKYRLENNLILPEKDELIENIIGVKTNTGEHPGGLILAGENEKILDYTPTEDKLSVNETRFYEITHLDCHFLNYHLLKVDLLGCDWLDKLNKLQEITGISWKQVDFRDKKILELFKEDERGKIKTDYLLEFKSEKAKDAIRIVKPEKIEDLIKISSALHGTDVWENNVENLLYEHKIDEIACSRDDIFLFLQEKGLDREIAFKIMEFVRRGKACKENWKEEWDEYVNIMRKAHIPEWYISSLEKIRYMFPKAHSCNYVVISLIQAWYKIYYPEEFDKVMKEG